MSLEAELLQDLNQQTAKIAWRELQKFFARGEVIAVASELDLIQVACDFKRDNSARIQQLLSAGDLFKPDDAKALAWLEKDQCMWAVVLAPWVLVQEVKDDAT